MSARGYRRMTLFAGYDVDSATDVFPRFQSLDGSIWLPGQTNHIRVQNGAATTDIKALVAGQNPFTDVAVGDLIRLWVNGKEEERIVLTRADADNITVAALDLSGDSRGYTFAYRNLVVGAGAEEGWFSIEGLDDVNIAVQVGTKTSGDVVFTLYGRIRGVGQLPVSLGAATITAANTAAELPVPTTRIRALGFNELRVGVKVAADAGNDIVSCYVLGSIGDD